MKIIQIHNILKKENANAIKKWFIYLSPIKRKNLLKYFSKNNKLIDIYKYVVSNRISRYFYMRGYSKNVVFYKNYLKNLYIMLSYNQFNIDHNNFHKFWNLNRQEIEYIDKLLFVDDDFYSNERKYQPLVKGICKDYYNINHVLDFLDIKYKKNLKNKKIYWELKSCFII